MTIASGSRLGPYEIVAPLGAGGMGEVYRARDTRLDRSVAVKVLPPLLSSSPDARQRFEREAKAISKLSHPHICALYDIGREGETDYLVMELLEGETLSARLARGQLPLEQTLRCGIEIAGALEKAHRLGIVHRDLKPGNVMLTKAGVKLLDFGLAKVLQPAPPLESLTSAPTAAKDITREGTILGTLQYMAPEQLEGREVDARTDVFALGCVLYEMATGRKAFAGASQASVIAAILAAPPPPTSSSHAVPRSLDRVVQTCLARDPDDRWQSAGDVGKELAWLAQDPSAEPAAARKSRPVLPWIVAAAAIAIAFASALALLMRPRAAPAELTRFRILAPQGLKLLPQSYLSPDARRLLMLLQDDAGRDLLGVRSLDSLEVRRLSGTEDARGGFWSADGRQIAFFSEGKLKRMPAEGGPAQVVCESGGAFTGAWGQDGTILFSKEFATPILAVSAAGGSPRPVTTLDTARGEVWHSHPAFLPDGRHFVFAATNLDPEKTSVMLGSLDTKEVRRLFLADSSAFYAEPGYLLFGRDSALFAWRFDPHKLQLVGEPVPAFDQVRCWRQDNLVAASAAGNRLVYVTWIGRRNLVWVDRRGRELGTLGETASYSDARVSPDGRKVAVARRDLAHGQNLDVWVLDASRGTSSRVTSEQTDDFNPAWFPDSERVAYVTSANGAFDIYERPAGGGQAKPLARSGEDKVLPSLSPDGRHLLVARGEQSIFSRVILPVDGKGEPVRLTEGTRSSEQHPEYSPDGRWTAFDSNESGQREVYVQAVSGGEKRQVSIGGGQWPVWNRAGAEIFYAARDGMLMSVSLRLASDRVEAGEPQPLFLLQLGTQGELPWVSHPFDVSPDGQRFLIIRRARDAEPDGTVVVTNWTAALAERR
ncbi:MAG TPA: protein kinase [Thermoanaerobaculia bacterium]|nr:protein kinase [Thermoanaerobaculia bacterium]